MSESSSRSPDKSGGTGACTTIGYRFYSGSEELGELQSEAVDSHKCINSDPNLDLLKIKPSLVSSGSLDTVKYDDDKNELLGENIKDYWGLLGRSISVDSSYQSPFSNPLETWKKLNELKGKITKTVEEKISEMKMDHGVSSHFKLNSSKENSSISDSEGTSECSKLSEQWRDAEDLNLSLKEVINKTTDMLSNTLDTALQNAKSEMEAEGELRHRKSYAKFSDVKKISEIKIAMAKSDLDSSNADDSITEDIESGVEAEENLDSVSLNALDDLSLTRSPLRESHTPPGGSGFINGFFSFFITQPYSKLNNLILLVGCGLYFLMPISDFSKGFAFCLLTVFFFLKLKNYFLKDDLLYLQQGNCVLPDYNLLPPLKVPEYAPVKGVWLNEYERQIYDPDYYSVSQTVPVYLELDNSILKLSRPKGKINKRATIDEPEYKLQFLNQRVYNISGCNVLLLPEGLTRKRLYSKKYPIVILLKPDSFIGEKNLEEKENSEAMEGDDINLTIPSSTLPPNLKSTLYLFSRCDRQKEEWYRKLLAATRLSSSSTPEEYKIEKDHELYKKQHHHHHHFLHNQSDLNHKSDTNRLENWNGKKNLERESQKKNLEEQVNVAETSTPFENLFFDPEEAYMEEYIQYMARFVHTSKANRLSRTKVNEEPEWEEPTLTKPLKFQIQWFNAFLNRILFDVFRSPYWLAKIHDKLYKKLNSIRLPYYVEEIEVIEMDLGKTGPMFHRVSQPYLDERGLWFDMDTTFDGLIKLTIQTHLNLVKLQKGMQEEEAIKNVLEKPKSPIYDSEVEDSAESSDDDIEEEEEITPLIPPETEEPPAPISVARRYPKNRRSSKKLFRMFENVAQSKYFKSMAQSKYIQKAIAGFSATKLKLTLEIKSCSGTLAVNIPPPPSDRFWYGFREMPKLIFSANPKIGEKAVRFFQIKNYLQRKILHEIKKAMVVPNMIDFVLPTSRRRKSSSSQHTDETTFPTVTNPFRFS